MSGVNTEDWLDDWIEENIQNPGYCQEKGEMATDAAKCRENAKAAGITDAELNRVAGGDLERYLMNAQNSFTDSEIRRRAEDDKH